MNNKQYGNIPSELKQLPNWVCWNIQKQPINAKTGGLAMPNNPSTWSDFNTAVQAVDIYNLNGVGFVISSPYIAVDLDTVRNPETGEICTEAQFILDTVVSYTEISQSGTGFHIICRADFTPQKNKKPLPCDTIIERYNHKNELKKNEIEMYSRLHYFALTGNIYDNRTEITEQTGNVKIIHDKYMIDKVNKPTVGATVQPLSISEGDILAIAMKDDVFRTLWHGDITGHQSHSEADLALCNKLAFYCGKDIDMMDRLFRDSALYRSDKWEREDYRAATLNAAIAGTNAIYDPNYKRNHVTVSKKADFEQSVDIASDDLYQRNYIYQEGERYKVNVPLLTEYFKQAVKYYLVKTDEFADTFMYVYRDGRYRVLMKDEIKGIIKSMIPLLLQTNKILEETYSLIFAEADTTKFIPLEPFNSDENIINFKNGLLHLDTVELKAHTPDVLSTIQIDCNYNPNAKQPANSYFEKYMQNLTGGKEDIRKFLLQYMGVALSNVYGFRFKKAFFMTGKGDSGKSQIKELCVKLIGSEYTSGIDLQTLEERFGTSAVYNKRLVGSSDMKYVSVKELNNFKQITGGDSIRIEFKNRGSFAYKFKGVFWFICNDLPKFGGDKGQHMYDRIIPLSFNNVIPEDKRDSHLLDKMYAEREYIVNLCIDGLKQVIANGYRYDIPMCSYDILRQYQHQNDSVLQFYDECCEPRINGVINDHITKGKTYQYYKIWCRMNNNGHSESKSGFHKRLQENKIGETTKTNGGNEYYISFKMAGNAVSEYGAMIN